MLCEVQCTYIIKNIILLIHWLNHDYRLLSNTHKKEHTQRKSQIMFQMLLIWYSSNLSASVTFQSFVQTMTSSSLQTSVTSRISCWNVAHRSHTVGHSTVKRTLVCHTKRTLPMHRYMFKKIYSWLLYYNRIRAKCWTPYLVYRK